MALTKEQLSMTLRGYGLSKDEIEAAWKRTEILQEAITKGKEFYNKNNIPVGEIRPQMLRVVPEKDWCKYDLDSLSPGRIRNVQKINQFYMMKSMKLQTINAYKSNKKKEAEKTREQKLRKEIFGEPIPKNKKIEPLNGKPVGTGIKYSLQKTDILGIDNPEHIRLEMPGDQTFSRMSGNNNSRFPISYTGSDGRPVEGFFTAAASVNGKAQLRQLFENAISAQQGENGNPEYAEVFRRTFEYISSGADKDRYSFSDYDLKKLGYDEETASRLRSDRLFHRIYTKLLYDAVMLPEKLKSDYIDTGADRNGTIEKRNVAMSKVGELLGTPNVLAHATTMQIKVGDKITEGVFMDRAPGIDINAIRPGDEFAKHTATAFDGSPALKDLADIQLLDYICFNHDRNVSNLFLKLSEDKTKVIGITGIDNDNSFGTIRLAPDKRYFMEPTLDSITVVSERMAEKIRVMTTNGLVHTLEGQGLTKKEIFAAVDRFSLVKDRIESGQIRVVKDEEWEKMKLSELADNEKSLFSGVNKAFAVMMPEKLKEMEPDKPVEAPVFAHGNKVDKFSPEAVQKTELDEKIQKKQDEILKDFREELRIAKSERSLNDTELLKKVTYYANVFKDKVDEGKSIFHKASTFYTDLSDRADTLAGYAKELDTKVKSGTALSAEDISGIISRVNNVKNAAENYVSHVNDNANPSRMQKKRKPLAESMSTNADALSNLVTITEQKREVEANPEEVMHRKLHSRQGLVVNGNLDDDNFRNQVATVIYMTCLVKNAGNLVKENKMINALLQSTLNANVERIKNEPAFEEMFKHNTKEQIIELVKEGTGQKLLTEYVKHQVQIEAGGPKVAEGQKKQAGKGDAGKEHHKAL